MSSKSKQKRPVKVTLNKAVTMAEVFFVWAWVSAMEPSKDDFNRVIDEMRNVRGSINSGNLTLREIREALKDEYDWECAST